MSFDFEKEAFRASGVLKDDRITKYIRKLGTLRRRFIQDMKPGKDPLNRAKALFDWLWLTKPTRYQRGGPFRLNKVIDAQLRKENCVVGNCLGLTLLYNSLARRLNLEVVALYLEHAFGRAPHVLTILAARDLLFDIEHSLPEGFNYKGHLDSPARERWGERELIADIYHSKANECYERGAYKEALKYYESTIDLNPRYEKALLNKAIVLDKIDMEENGSPLTTKTKH
jgi:tetratricopeptide (TPR) repeat protein